MNHAFPLSADAGPVRAVLLREFRDALINRYFQVFAALSLAACATYANGPIVDGGPVRADGMAMLGQPTRVGRLVVTPISVVEDSRCPINARCVWAGRLVLATRIDAGRRHETRDLTLGKSEAVLGTTMTLTSAEPGKLAGAQPPQPPTLFGFEGGR